MPIELSYKDTHILRLAFLALCGLSDGVHTEEFLENARHAARAVGVYDDTLEAALSIAAERGRSAQAPREEQDEDT